MTAGSGNITLGVGASGTDSIDGDINDVALTTTGSIILKGDITTATDSNDTSTTTGSPATAAGDVVLTGPVLLLPSGAGITIDTNSSNNNGKVTFTSTVDSSAANAGKTLTVLSGSGAVDFGGAVGATATKHLGGLSVNATGTDSGTIDIVAIGTATDPGVETGNVVLGTSNTTGVDLDGTIYNVGSGGDITITSTSSGQAITMGSAGATTVKTANGTINFDTGTISTAHNLDISSAGGAISINAVRGSGTATSLTVNADGNTCLLYTSPSPRDNR